MADVTEFHSTQHEKQKDAWKTNDLPKELEISSRNRKAIRLHLIKRKHMKYSRDAEANGMIHKGSDHRCVMATFVLNTPKKNIAPVEKLTALKNKAEHPKTGRQNNSEEESIFEQRYSEILEKIKEKAEAANTESRKSEAKNR